MVLHHAAVRRGHPDGPRGPGALHAVPPPEFADLRAALREHLPLPPCVRLARTHPVGNRRRSRPRVIRGAPRSSPASGGPLRVDARVPPPDSESRVLGSRGAPSRSPNLDRGPAAEFVLVRSSCPCLSVRRSRPGPSPFPRRWLRVPSRASARRVLQSLLPCEKRARARLRGSSRSLSSRFARERLPRCRPSVFSRVDRAPSSGLGTPPSPSRTVVRAAPGPRRRGRPFPPRPAGPRVEPPPLGHAPSVRGSSRPLLSPRT